MNVFSVGPLPESSKSKSPVTASSGGKKCWSLLLRSWLFKLKDNLTLRPLSPVFTTQPSVKVGWLLCGSDALVVRLWWLSKRPVCRQMLAVVSSLCSRIGKIWLGCERYSSRWHEMQERVGECCRSPWDTVVSFKVVRVLISEGTGWAGCCCYCTVRVGLQVGRKKGSK